MALSDYLNGPQHKARSVRLEAELNAAKRRCAGVEAELLTLNDRYAQLQALAEQYGALEVIEIQCKIAAEKQTLQTAKEAIAQTEREAATMADRIKMLRGQVLAVA